MKPTTTVVALVASITSTAAARDKAECLGAYESGQPARAEGRLREAREKFLICAAEPCAEAMRRECAGWLREVEEAIPTIVPVAREGAHDIAGVRFFVDGREVAARIDGTPIPLDPGERRFRFERGDGASVERVEVLHAGEKLKRIVAEFPEPPPRVERASWPGWLFVGTAAVGLASFGYFGLTGVARYERLKGTCAPSCAKSDADAVQTKLVIADVSLGVTALSLAGAGWWWLGRDRTAGTAVTGGGVAVGGIF